MAARLLPMAQGGARPRVIGLLTAVPPADWSGSLLNPSDAASFADQASQAAGRFPVPVAVDIQGAAGYQITQEASVEAGQTTPGRGRFHRRQRNSGTRRHRGGDRSGTAHRIEALD